MQTENGVYRSRWSMPTNGMVIAVLMVDWQGGSHAARWNRKRHWTD